MRLLRIIGVLVLAAGLGACSTVKLAYGSLDDIAYWWLDGYLDFTDGQSRQVKDDLARLHQWHRAQELPKVAELLHRMEEAATGPVTADQVCAFVPPVRERVQALLDQAEGPAAALARDLRPDQLAHLDKRYQRKNAEFRKDWVQPPAAEWHEKRVKDIAERAETLYGSVSDAQRAAIMDFVARSAFDPLRMDTERLRRQQDTLSVLRRIVAQRMDPAAARLQVRELVLRTQFSPDAGYRAYQDLMQREGCALAATMQDRSTPAQREHAVRRLRGWQRDLKGLAAAK